MVTHERHIARNEIIVRCNSRTATEALCTTIIFYQDHINPYTQRSTTTFHSEAFDELIQAPQPVMVGGLFLYLMAPVWLPTASMDLTTFMDATSPSGTWPKTTCLLSSQEVTTVVMKNWEPLLERVVSIIVQLEERFVCRCWYVTSRG